MENEYTNTTAQFQIIGFDLVSDILVAIYDPLLNYNIIQKPDFSKQLFLNLNYNYDYLLGEILYLCSNIGFYNNLSTIMSTIVNTSYSGGFGITNADNIIPESVLLQTTSFISSVCGSPVIAKK